MPQVQTEEKLQLIEMPIYTYYERSGVSVDTIPAYVKRILETVRSEQPNEQNDSFYLNSSDATEVLLHNEDVTGKRVLTVSGSGEFAHIFAKNGASEICAFDISPAAAFYAEMRHVGLCILPFEHYKKMFGSWLPEPEPLEERKPIFDKSVYEEIKPNMSIEAQTFFDLVARTPELFDSTMFNSWSGFSRIRTNKNTGFNRLVGDIITDEGDYLTLQDKARRVQFTQVIWDAREISDLVTAYKPDVMYISNIGYYPDKTIALAKKYLDMGVGEVVFTVSKNDETFHRSPTENPYDYDHYYYDQKMLRIGSKFDYEVINDKTGNYEAVKVEVVGLDTGADYGLVLKAVQSGKN